MNFNSRTIKEFLLKKSKIYKFINYSEIKEIMKNKDLINKYKNFLFNFLNLKIVLDN